MRCVIGSRGGNARPDRAGYVKLRPSRRPRPGRGHAGHRLCRLRSLTLAPLAATLNNDGIVNIPGATGTGVFSVASVNVGGSGSITASA